jgi:hypothetical protein
MAGLATVVGRIQDDLNRGSDFAARIRRAITDAIFYHRAMRFGWNQKRKTFTVSSEFTSLTANWIEIDSLVLHTNGDELLPLKQVPFGTLECWQRDGDEEDEPTHYAIHYRQLRLWERPDQTYSVVMSYVYDLLPTSDPSLSDSFSTAWLTEGEQMIRLHAQGDVLVNYIDGPEAIAKGQLCKQQSEMIMKQLKRRANREQGTGVVRSWL